MSTDGKVCAETVSQREKLSRPAKNGSTTPQHPAKLSRNSQFEQTSFPFCQAVRNNGYVLLFCMRGQLTLRSQHPEAIQIVILQSVEKIPNPSVTNRRIGPFHTALSENIGVLGRFCRPLLENSKTDTTFLLRSPKTEKEHSLTD